MTEVDIIILLKSYYNTYKSKPHVLGYIYYYLTYKIAHGLLTKYTKAPYTHIIVIWHTPT